MQGFVQDFFGEVGEVCGTVYVGVHEHAAHMHYIGVHAS